MYAVEYVCLQLSMYAVEYVTYAVEYITRDVRTFLGILLYDSDSWRQSAIFFVAVIAARRFAGRAGDAVSLALVNALLSGAAA